MKTKTILLFTLLAFFGQTLFAQTGNIRGKVTDSSDGSPVIAATAILLRPDSTYVSGNTTDPEGFVELRNVPVGDYLLTVSFLGYETYRARLSHAADEELEIPLNPSALALDEVTIVAHSVILKPDRKVILPSPEQVRTSTDGADLVRKMQLPRIMVDPLNGEVTMSGGGEVQLRINGVRVSGSEVTALLPADIIRIEYHDDPGARYGQAAAVIDYITRQRNTGGSVNGSFMNAVSSVKTSADDFLSARFNRGKSEFAANVAFQQRKQHWTREYDEKFVFPDHSLHRLEVGEPTLFNKKVFRGNLNYSLSDPGRYFLNAQLNYTLNDFPNSFGDRQSKLYTEGESTPVSIRDHTSEKIKTPSLDLYFQRNLKNDQSLIFNVVGTYIDTDNSRIYRESRDLSVENEIRSQVSGEKYSLIGEALYENRLGSGKLSAGARHLQAYTGNAYAGTTTAEVYLRQAESYVYAEYQGTAGKWGYMANVTGARIYYSQDGRGKERYTVQPSARLSFEPNRDLSLRYRIGLRTNTPQLAYLNDVEQRIDPLQVRRGNPGLDSYRTLSQLFSAGYNKGVWGIDLTLGYDYEYDPIMESVKYEEGQFVRTYENQHSFQQLSAELTLKIKPWKNHLTVSLTPRLDRFISKGNDYLHTYTLPEFRAALDFSYDWFVASFNTITPYRYLYGEQLTKSEQMYTIMVGYKAPSWSVLVGGLSPFTKNYKTENENWSALNPVTSTIHTTHMTRTFLVKLSFNLGYGNQFKGARKVTNNRDEEAGVISGSKQ